MEEQRSPCIVWIASLPKRIREHGRNVYPMFGAEALDVVAMFERAADDPRGPTLFCPGMDHGSSSVILGRATICFASMYEDMRMLSETERVPVCPS